jgi:hypothetical protein
MRENGDPPRIVIYKKVWFSRILTYHHLMNQQQKAEEYKARKLAEDPPNKQFLQEDFIIPGYV